MNKSDFVGLLASEAGTSLSTASSFLKALESAFVMALSREEKVQLTGLLTFSVKDVPATEGRNPKTGKPIKIGATSRISIKAGKKLKEQVKAKRKRK